MSDNKTVYRGKEYTREPAPLFRAWEGICTGCAFRDDADMCIETCNKDDPETHCYIEGKNYIFKECQKDDTKAG